MTKVKLANQRFETDFCRCYFLALVLVRSGFAANRTAQNRENVMHDKQVAAPDDTAVRVALWRALHVQADSPPHVLEDEVGLRLALPTTDGEADRT